MKLAPQGLADPKASVMRDRAVANIYIVRTRSNNVFIREYIKDRYCYSAIGKTKDRFQNRQ